MWLDEWMLVLGTGRWTSLMAFEPSALIETERHRRTGTFTPSGCATYEIDPGPALDEVRSG